MPPTTSDQPPSTPHDHPASLVWIASGVLDVSDPLGHNPFAPLPAHLAMALVCLRRAGFAAQTIKRAAAMQRNESDNALRDALRKNCEGNPAFTALLDNAAARRTPEGDLVSRDVYAIEVEHADALWIVDGWGNLGDDEILAAAAADANRQPGHFTGAWERSYDRQVVLDQLERSSPALDKVIAAWQAHDLQCDTPKAPHASPRPRI